FRAPWGCAPPPPQLCQAPLRSRSGIAERWKTDSTMVSTGVVTLEKYADVESRRAVDGALVFHLVQARGHAAVDVLDVVRDLRSVTQRCYPPHEESRPSKTIAGFDLRNDIARKGGDLGALVLDARPQILDGEADVGS